MVRRLGQPRERLSAQVFVRRIGRGRRLAWYSLVKDCHDGRLAGGVGRGSPRRVSRRGCRCLRPRTIQPMCCACASAACAGRQGLVGPTDPVVHNNFHWWWVSIVPSPPAASRMLRVPTGWGTRVINCPRDPWLLRKVVMEGCRMCGWRQGEREDDEGEGQLRLQHGSS